ncbi:MAG: hypothetical protein AAGF26_05175 [Cyanobacteria bacterium P01_G01_bin.49]
MKIINKLEILAVFTTICLTLGYQPAYSLDRAKSSEIAEKEDSKTVAAEFVQANAFFPSSQAVIQINDSLTSLPIPVPQPLIILCVLGMAGFSSVLKLKIAQAKYQQKEYQEIEETKIPELVNH